MYLKLTNKAQKFRFLNINFYERKSVVLVAEKNKGILAFTETKMARNSLVHSKMICKNNLFGICSRACLFRKKINVPLQA